MIRRQNTESLAEWILMSAHASSPARNPYVRQDKKNEAFLKETGRQPVVIAKTIMLDVPACAVHVPDTSRHIQHYGFWRFFAMTTGHRPVSFKRASFL